MAPPDLNTIARRAVAFVAESLARFENLLFDNEYRLNSNENQVLVSLQRRAVDIRTRLFRRVQALMRAKDANSSLGLARNTVEATPIYSSIVELHRDLRHLPIPDLRTESEVFLRTIWAPLQPLVTKTDAPSLHLSHDLIHGQHTVTLGPAVIDLPKVDYSTPLTWPLIGHEIAHAVLPTVDVPPNLSQTVSNWLVEAGCDRLAYRLCGPAYFAAFSLRTFVDRTYAAGTNKHPPGRLRIQAFVDNPPADRDPEDLFKLILELASARRTATETGGVKLQEAGSRVLKCQSCKKPFTEIETAEAERLFVQVLPDYLADLDSQSSALQSVRPSSEHTAVLAKHLVARRLIGASHDEAASSREFAKFSGTKTRNESRRATLLENAIRTLEDEPNRVIDIVTAGWRAYLAKLSDEAFLDVIRASEDDSSDEQWLRYKGSVRHWDELLLASIETAHFQSLIEGKQ